MNELIALAASEDVSKYPVAGFELGTLSSTLQATTGLQSHTPRACILAV
eukprot:COSAG02_NODE_1123_length_14441_cov_28.984521_17_plen_49_part_00